MAMNEFEIRDELQEKRRPSGSYYALEEYCKWRYSVWIYGV